MGNDVVKSAVHGRSFSGAPRRRVSPSSVGLVLVLLLLASFSFRSEKNFFAVGSANYHSDLPGFSISLMLLSSVLLLATRRHRRPGDPLGVLPPPFLWTGGLVFAWCVVSTLTGAERWLGVCMLWSLAASLLMCLVVAEEFDSRRALRLVVLTFAVGVAINGGVATVQSTMNVIVDWKRLGAAPDHRMVGGSILRGTGFRGETNALAWYLVSFLPLLLAPQIVNRWRGRRWERLVLAAAVGLGFVGLVRTYSRGSWVAFIACLGIFLVLLPRVVHREQLRQARRRLVVAVVVMAILALPSAGSIHTRLTETKREDDLIRLPMMELASNIVKDKPLLGVGLNAYESVMRSYDSTAVRVTEKAHWPVHNIYLHMAAEGGLPVLVGFVVLMTLALRAGWRAMGARDPVLRSHALGLTVGLLGFLIVGLKETSSIGSPLLRIAFLLGGLLMAVDHVARHARPAARASATTRATR